MAEFSVPMLPPIVPLLGLHPLYFTVARAEVNYVKSVLESYEHFGVVRAQAPHYRPGQALLVLLLVPDFAAPALEVLRELAAGVELGFPPPSQAWIDALARDLGLEAPPAGEGEPAQASRRKT